MNKLTATQAAILNQAGFDSDDALWDFIAEQTTSVAGRIATRLSQALDDIQSAERGVKYSLHSLADATARQQKSQTDGLQVDPTWVVQHAERVAKASDQLAAAIERARELASFLVTK